MSDQAAIVIVGQGSIGKRHAEIVKALGHRVHTVSRRVGQGSHGSIRAALDSGPCRAVAIATETSRHAENLAELAGARFAGRVLVEKPALASLSELTAPLPSGPIAVGYNLRFSPVVRALRNALAHSDQPVAAEFHVGQSLSEWRPGRTRESSYSAYKASGGGVLRDLSHELDLATWLLGPALRVAAIGGRYSEETVDSDDLWSILLVCRDCPQVTVTLNCIERPARRHVVVTTARQTLAANLLTGELTVEGRTNRFEAARNETYSRLWTSFLGEGKGSDGLCNWDEAVRVVALIDAIELANRTSRWIEPTRTETAHA